MRYLALLSSVLLFVPACGDSKTSNDEDTMSDDDADDDDDDDTQGKGGEGADDGADDDQQDGKGDDDGDDDDAGDDDAGDDDDADDDAGDDDADDDADDDGDDDGDDDDGDAGDDDAGDDDEPQASVDFVGEGVECGSARCQDAEVSWSGENSVTVMGCCADEDAEQCGLQLAGIGALLSLQNAGCEPLDLPGSEDPSCGESDPPVTTLIAPTMPLTFPGCCQQTGQCGYQADIQGIGFGCVSPTRFGRDEGEDCDYAD